MAFLVVLSTISPKNKKHVDNKSYKIAIVFTVCTVYAMHHEYYYYCIILSLSHLAVRGSQKTSDRLVM